ncbi:MAG: cobaltochelatase CobT-related protein [Alphaproteobacteria bacterium]
MTFYENENTAKIISKNKIKLLIKDKDLISNSENKFLDESIKFENKTIFEKGWYDFFSLKIRYIDEKLFVQNIPDTKLSTRFYKILLEARSLSIGFSKFVGCKINVEKILNEIKNQFYKDSKNNEGLFFEFFLLKFQSKETKNLKFFKTFPMINNNKIKLLKNNLEKNKFYEIAKKISNLLQQEEMKEENQNNISKKTTQKSKSLTKDKKKIPLNKERKKQTKDPQNPKNSNQSEENNKIEVLNKYKIFTREFDVAKNAEKLVESNELNDLRKKFDEECKDYTKLINELAKKLKKLLLAFDTTAWEFSQDEGSFDGSRFAAFIANNDNSSIYKLEKKNVEKNTIVSLLMDNSGSMRGKPIITSALTSEILTHTLEKCNVNVEILGFTTNEWKGGKSKKKWESLDRPNKPGRLNDLLHIIYKDADASWSVAKKNIGLILKEGLLKENIDGEALIWASSRLKRRNEKKKILIVISDGAPVDDSTLSVNNPNILENHLKEVVTEIEQEGRINLVAIGIGHDVSRYYKKAFTIDSPDKLGDIIIENLAENLG